MRSIAAGMSPAKIAMAVAATIAPSAGTGGMKNVIGTRSAVAIVAVNPGMAPTKIPNADDATITHKTYGSKIRRAASSRGPTGAASHDGGQPAARQRHAQQRSEEILDRDGRDDGSQHRGDRPNPDPQEHASEK